MKSFDDVIRMAGERPPDDASSKSKKNYSEKLSNAIAILLAQLLRETGRLPSVLPEIDGSGRESRSVAGSLRKFKKTDVRCSTLDTGLELLVSIKTLNFRNTMTRAGRTSLGRYTKNMVRNDHELRAEAMDHHERFPYAVLIGVFFIPVDACDDAITATSSFAHAVMTFRGRAGRRNPDDHPAKFERVFIGLYDADGADGSRVGFFDVLDAPPRRGRPPWPNETPEPMRGGRLLSLRELIAEIVREYGIRNRSYIEWADESPAPGTVPELDPPGETEDGPPNDVF